jgi:hypothetical protein
VSRRTIVSIEATDDVPSANVATLEAVRKALEAAGIEFIGSPDDGPGIRIRRPAGQS